MSKKELGRPAWRRDRRCAGSICTAIRGPQEWIASQGPYVEALGQYWGKEWAGKSEDDVVADVSAAGVEAVLVAFDIESVTGAPPCTNAYVAALRDRHPGDVHRRLGGGRPVQGRAGDRRGGDARSASTACSASTSTRSWGTTRSTSRALNPLFETIAGLGVPVMIDVGTTGMGAGMPGGLGARLEHARPLAIDNLAARFPALTIIAAHPGWPWTDEMTAVALHKGNVYWELSGWAPKYFPPSLRTDIRGRLREKMMFGSDHPSLPLRADPAGVGRARLRPVRAGPGLPRQRRTGPGALTVFPWPPWTTCGRSRCRCRAPPST